MSNKIIGKTVSHITELPEVKLSELFSHAAIAGHSSHHAAVPSPFERELKKQGYTISTGLRFLKDYLFLKPSEDLLTAFSESPYGDGYTTEYIGIEKTGYMSNHYLVSVTREMIKESPNDIYWTNQLYVGFIDKEEFEALKAQLLSKGGDSFIELGQEGEADA